MIALLCSVPAEADRLLANISSVESISLGSKTFFRGRLSGREIALCTGGMGKTNAAHAATLMIMQYAPRALIIFGIGGAYPGSGAGIGDIALASEEIYADEGVLIGDGFRPADFIGISLAKIGMLELHNHIPASSDLLGMLRDLLAPSYSVDKVHGYGPSVMTGRFVTVSTATGTDQRAAEIEEMYHPLCENMEGAAAAHVATMHGVPWAEIRSISNIVEDRDTSKWDIPRAAAAVQDAVMRIVEAIK